MSGTYYSVCKGHQTGIFDSWNEAKEQVDGYSGAVYKSFKTKEEAIAHWEQYRASQLGVEEKKEEKVSPLASLTHEQRAVIQHLLEGENLFLTGGGGVGKSYLLSVIYSHFPQLKYAYDKARNPSGSVKRVRIQMCALTGCAALLLGNKTKTVHSWAGIGLGKGTVQELHTKIRKSRRAMKNWLSTDLLVIDEISMMTADLLDKLNEIGKKIRSCRLPFGGIQLLFVGDFYQLPPVSRGEDGAIFAFESNTWREAISTTIELTILQRQKDPVFQKILCEARVGELSKESCRILKECQERDWKTHKIRPTLLFPRRAEVDMINESNLRALTDKHQHYFAQYLYDGKVPAGFSEDDPEFKRLVERFDAESPYAVDLELSLNAQVMLVANVDPDAGLVNGSRGVVIGFTGAMELPIVEFMNGVRRPIGQHAWPIEDYEFVSRSQIPLRLAYAVTIHKSQGSSLDCALVDIGSGIFEFGQSYVALSRLRFLDALYVYDFSPTAFKAHPKVKEFYRTLVVKEIPEEDRRQMEECEALLVPSEEEKELSVRPILAAQGVHVHKQDAVKENIDDIEPGNHPNWLFSSLPESWKDAMKPCESALQSLSHVLSAKTFLPSKESLWTALDLPMDQIRVVILGQDPYPTPGHAHGLAFSVQPTVSPLPPSLKNIYKELATDIDGFVAPSHGYLKKWMDQGVFLLNTVLTVEPGQPQSHTKLGWEAITDHILREIATHTRNTIFILWGKSAQVKKKMLESMEGGHHLFESAHPSPLSAHRGFFGSKPFSTINRWLEEDGRVPIDWSL